MNFHLLLDAEGRFVQVSKGFENWLTVPASNLEGRFITEFIRSAHLRSLNNFIGQKIPGDSLELNKAVFKGTGEIHKWANLTFSILTPSSTATNIMVSVQAIDDSGAAAISKLKQANFNFFNAHPHGVINIDVDGSVLHSNAQVTHDTGFSLEVLQQHGLLNLVTAKNRMDAIRGFIAATKQAKSSSLDVQIYTEGQELLFVNLTIVPVVFDGQTVELYAIVKNIGEHIALQQTLKKLSIVANKATNGVAVLDSDFSIELINDVFLKMCGHPRDYIIGKRLSDLITREDVDDIVLEEGRANLLNGVAIERELECFRSDGSSFWNFIKLTPIMSSEGKMEMCITVHTDITDKKKAELELRMLADDLYRQNKELHQFAYIVSHNMRSPVANIVGLANLLELFKDDPETQSQTLKELTKSVNNLDTVIKDLSYILTINNANKELLKEPVILQDLLQQVMVDLQPQILVTDADISIQTKPLVLRTNRAYIYSIFYNLISNAIKYKSHLRPFIKIDFYQTESHTVLYVADNGKGIDIEKHAHDLFKPYKRFDFKVEGKGLGLFLVKSHVEALGGSLTVKSELNKGSTFYIKIPFA
ncbi:sensor histidine kinase [Mucilaginibacter aquatilis]|uniref:histidine kinase n=1 Tax=Mucilaginibacter aquatilis TaxID=1517760 RepID=A0A6I4IBV4_9SPHI|nr:PAS domain-containing protein [Mucilaginibacter aquatilis]MVN91036.1 PAS domain-containing protein [Mucilaginibacter aquatilis]